MPRYNKGQNDEERSKQSLRRWYMKYHPYCEIASPTGAPSCMNAATRVLFSDDGCVSICEECFERLGISAMYVKERPHLRGVLPHLPLAPKTVEAQAEMDLS